MAIGNADLLSDVASAGVDALPGHYRDRLKSNMTKSEPMVLSSMCSGSDVMVDCEWSVMQASKAKFAADIRTLIQRFACEHDAWKLDQIDKKPCPVKPQKLFKALLACLMDRDLVDHHHCHPLPWLGH